MVRSALFSLLLALGAGSASAADEEAARPFVVDVYPRRDGAGGGGIDRAEALSRRMDRTEAAFRAICVGCGRGSPEAGASFYPYRVLNAAPPAEPAAE